MKFSIVALSALAAFIPYVSGHGFVTKVVIDGKEYDGPKPASTPGDSAIRMISTTSPVKGADNPSMTCGQDAQPATLNAAANPGSKLEITWMSGTGDTTWVHNVGPIMNYMASCGGNDCSSFNGSNAQFFKIEQSGIDSGTTWVQGETLYKGLPFDLTLPNNLSPGAYLLRHEVIALQGAQSAGGAEFYPSCIQLLIGGNADASTVATPTVSFPGAYSDSDPGIEVDVYDLSTPYVFPGGPVSNIASPDGNSTSSTSPAAGGSSASAAPAASSAPANAASSAPANAASTSVAAPSASATKTCKLSQKRMVKRHARMASH